ncbi:MAG: glycoside hydrolase family 127 protein [Ruminococcaceae bacterium]|nr:glycoside hydrolase family 127 protein [Oscillospiraceae bacterium]
MDFLFDNVTIEGGFIKEKQNLNIETTIWAVYNRFKETGRFDALKCLWKEGCEDIPKPHFFWDSDVAKWIEAASYVISKNPSKELEDIIEQAIDDIEKNQWEDGYISSYYTVVKDEQRLTNRDRHELYCIGHFIEAAIAYYYATGKDRLLKIMEKCVDFVYKVFFEEHSAAFDTPGHEEIEIALLRLYECTNNKKYFELAKYFLLTRGKSEKDIHHRPDLEMKYFQSDKDVYNLETAKGHAVRASYLYTAMAHYAKLSGDEKMLESCRTLFNDIVNKKMYITGGTGSISRTEAFTYDYDLPNEVAYAETCAAIALMFFSQKMLHVENKSVYADIVEKCFYNGMLSGISVDGEHFFYVNPLEIRLLNRTRSDNIKDESKRSERYPITQRVKVFNCSCCPPNVNRVLASFEQYIYHKNEDVFFVDQYVKSTYDDGKIKVITDTLYPVTGDVKIKCEGVKKLAVRIPAWCDNFALNASYEIKDGYAFIENPDEIELCFELKPKLVSANPSVFAVSNKVALMLGPVVYCSERIDNIVDNCKLYIDKNIKAEIEYSDEFMLNTVTVKGYERKSSDALYENFNEEFTETKIKLIPYSVFANRGESDMAVWLNYR